MDANNLKFKELADEQGLKTGQNVAAGVVGLVVWPMWFAMDFKGAADTLPAGSPTARTAFARAITDG